MERKDFIDISKGILIILVVIHHLPQVGNKMCGFDSGTLDYTDHLSFVFTAFFMQAFFVITGYCSNFNKPYSEFLKRNFISILVSGILLAIVSYVVKTTICLSFVYTINAAYIVGTFIKYGTAYWFLSSLFCCKLLLFALLKIRCNKTSILLLSVLFIIIGVLLNDIIPDDKNNYWYFHHSLFMFFPLVFGYCIKENYSKIEIYGKYYVIFYIVLMLLFCTFGIKIPYVTHAIRLTEIYEIPFYMTFSILGTLSVLYLAKFIDYRYLSFLGKNSLIVYCTHIDFLYLSEIAINKVVSPCNVLTTTIFYIFVLTLTFIAITTIIYMLNMKHLKWIIGR